MWCLVIVIINRMNVMGDPLVVGNLYAVSDGQSIARIRRDSRSGVARVTLGNQTSKGVCPIGPHVKRPEQLLLFSLASWDSLDLADVWTIISK